MTWHRVKTKSPALRAPKSGPTVIVGQSMEGHSPFPPEYASALPGSAPLRLFKVEAA
jgi:hypothetical protein